MTYRKRSSSGGNNRPGAIPAAVGVVALVCAAGMMQPSLAISSPSDADARLLVRTRWNMAELEARGWFSRRFTVLREYAPEGLFLMRAETDAERAIGNSDLLRGVLYAEPVYDYQAVRLREGSPTWRASTLAVSSKGMPLGEARTIIGFLGDGIVDEDAAVRAFLWNETGEPAVNAGDDAGRRYATMAHGVNCLGRRDSGPPPRDSVSTVVARSVSAALGEWAGRPPSDHGIRIMDLRVVNDSGQASLTSIFDCLEFAAQAGVKVLWLGWGAPHHSRALRDMLGWIASPAGMLVVVPSGEGPGEDAGAPLSPDDSFPSGFRLPNMLTVAAADPTGTLLDSSNYGGRVVHLAAVGMESGRGDAGASGGMMGSALAAGYVAAAAAVLRTSRPDLSPDESVSALVSSADEHPSMEGMTLSSGLLDLRTALAITRPGEILLVPGYAVTTVNGRIPFRATGGIGRYSWSLSNPALGVIDDEGVLRVTARGRTKVIVEDAAGNLGSSSYVVVGEGCEGEGFGHRVPSGSAHLYAGLGLLFFGLGGRSRGRP